MIGCRKSQNDTGDALSEGRSCASDADWGDHALCTAWQVNTDETSTRIVIENGAVGWTDVQTVEIDTSGAVPFARVQTTGVPV